MNYWEMADSLLAVVQALVEQMKAENKDDYHLLESAKEHIIAARGDLDADLK